MSFWVVCSIWNDDNVEPNAKVLTFQMVGSTRGTPSGFGAGGMAIHLHLLHRWVSLRFLPPRWKFCGNWFKLSSTRGVGITLIKHKKRATKISSVLSLRYSIKRMSLWTRTFGFAQSSPSFLYWLLLVPKQTRLATPRSSFADQLVCGGIITTGCYRLIMWWIGMSSNWHFEIIIFQLDFLTVSSTSSWL